MVVSWLGWFGVPPWLGKLCVFLYPQENKSFFKYKYTWKQILKHTHIYIHYIYIYTHYVCTNKYTPFPNTFSCIKHGSDFFVKLQRYQLRSRSGLSSRGDGMGQGGNYGMFICTRRVKHGKTMIPSGKLTVCELENGHRNSWSSMKIGYFQ